MVTPAAAHRAYADEIADRARHSGLMISVMAFLIVPAWAVVDPFLEPAHASAFLRLRLLSDLPILVLLLLLWRAPLGRRRPGLLTFLVLTVVQLELAWMVVRAGEAAEVYMLGFSLPIYASGCVLMGSAWWTGALSAGSCLTLLLAAATAPRGMSVPDLVTALSFAVTAALIGVFAHWQRDRLSTRELVARAGLEREQERTGELLARLDRLSHEDALTGLANRRRWDAALEQACRDAGDRGPVTVVLLDVDHFKAVNDRYGHAGGDQALRQVARLLSEQVGESGLAARLGGDELSVLLAGAGLEDGARLAERVRQDAAALDLPDGMRLTLSLGVASARGRDAAPSALMSHADAQLYRAKVRRNAVSAGRTRDPLPSQRNSPDGSVERC